MNKERITIEQKIKYVQDTLYVVNGKWKLPILVAIHEGNNRFKTIQRSVPGITSKILANELKELELNKLVVRTVHDSFPVLIEYTPSIYCETLSSLINEMINWGKNHRNKIREE